MSEVLKILNVTNLKYFEILEGQLLSYYDTSISICSLYIHKDVNKHNIRIYVHIHISIIEI